MQFQLALAGALNGWQYGLITAVSPLAEREDSKDLMFDGEVEGIRAAAAAAAETGKAGADGEGSTSTAGNREKAKGRAIPV